MYKNTNYKLKYKKHKCMHKELKKIQIYESMFIFSEQSLYIFGLIFFHLTIIYFVKREVATK
jgi:hypothetical protein